MHPIYTQIEFDRGTIKDYNILAPYHYLKSPLGPRKAIFIIKPKLPRGKHLPRPIGVCVICCPVPNLKARTKAIGHLLPPFNETTDRFRFINQNILYLARLIIDPRFRRLGLATWLHNNVCGELSDYMLETQTPIDFTNKMLIESGFTLYHTPAPDYYTRFKNALANAGITGSTLKIPKVAHERITHLPPAESNVLEYEIQRFIQNFKKRQHMEHSQERTLFFLRKIDYPEAYLINTNKSLL